MRRGVGIGGIKRRDEEKQSYGAVAKEIADVELQHIQQSMLLFQQHLNDFAIKHRQDINKNSTFRQQFTHLCYSTGVDPLNSKKTFFSTVLGIGDFYYTLAVQCVDACIATRKQNGGLITLQQLLQEVRKKRAAPVSATPLPPNNKYSSKSKATSNDDNDIDADDILNAIDKLAVLGAGFRVIKIPIQALPSTQSRIPSKQAQAQEQQYTRMILSVPSELNTDHIRLMQEADNNAAGCYITIEMLEKRCNWTTDRVHVVLKQMLADGMIWVDTQCRDTNNRPITAYWVASLFKYDT